ncbi:FAD-binding oxidoreductase [Paraburkholderia sp. J8-2]|uniref:NAD(P)/FAD-dependent oxidoreductase n=1 Tax=Paraburkholderia sp. J8-2 TaxID=2805440 RepID=UPI002AB7D767|nr:FAD-binding oxidoreductase [Paraburkholderia sp. J8-2]
MLRVPEQTTPYGLWEITGAPRSEARRINGDVSTDIAIVGGGFCGLSAALHLAEAGLAPLVLEAQEPGFGASGRNGGQVIAGIKLDPSELAVRFRPAEAEALYRFGAGTAETVFSLIERFQIRCEAHRDGWIQAAHSPAMLKAVRRRVTELQDKGADVEWLDSEVIQRMIGTPYYKGGMIDRRSGMVQPLSYARGLAGAAASMGATILGNTPVRRLTRDGAAWRLETPGGTVLARHVLLATNGYLGDLYPVLKTAMIVVQSYQIATEPLPPDLDRTVVPSRLPVSDLMDLGLYFRRDDAGRFIAGGGGSLTDKEEPALFHALARSANILFPQLSETPFTSRWGGKLTLTRDHLPRVIELEPGLVAAYGCNGRGVALATVMGRLAAERIRGITHTDLPVAVMEPARYAFHNLRLPVMMTVRKFRRLRRRFARA